MKKTNKEKPKALTVKQLKTIQENITAITAQDQLPPQLMEQLENKLPDYVKDMENDGTGVIRAAFEYTAFIEHVLMAEFGFTDKEIQKFNSVVKKGLPLLPQMKFDLPVLLKPAHFEAVLTMAKQNKKLYERQRKGEFLPNPEEQKKLK